jgi:hypothetical protein
MTILAPRTVLVSTQDLAGFKSKGPCSGIPDDLCVSFEFGSNGDLVDVNWYSDNGIDVPRPEYLDGSAELALSQDAQAFLIAPLKDGE